MPEEGGHARETDSSVSLQDQLQKAAGDLWSMIVESGADYVVFTDHRRLQTRVERGNDGMYHVSWEPDDEDGEWICHVNPFAELREAAFHGFQGPH